MQLRLLIVADDLTGAADSAAPFLSAGMNACISLPCCSADASNLLSAYNVISLSTETRDLPASDSDNIAGIVSAALAPVLHELPRSLVFKKIDSTLRGHLGTELEALRRSIPNRTAIICPAFPEAGRTVNDGILSVNSKLSDIASQEVVVSTAFDSTSPRECIALNLAAVRSGNLSHSLTELRKRGTKSIFFDAETDQDLDKVAAAILREPTCWLPVGSSGFSRAIARCCSDVMPSDLSPHPQSYDSFEKVLVLVGTQNPVSRKQAERLEKVRRISHTASFGAAHQELIDGQDVSLAMSANELQEAETAAENLLCGTPESADAYEQILVVATGGATGAGFVNRLEAVDHLQIAGELEPGAVILQTVTAIPGRRILMVLKAGGFGDIEFLIRCVETFLSSAETTR